jgi:hypothetical protein
LAVLGELAVAFIIALSSFQIWTSRPGSVGVRWDVLDA